jgi:hypothetical protein
MRRIVAQAHEAVSRSGDVAQTTMRRASRTCGKRGGGDTPPAGRDSGLKLAAPDGSERAPAYPWTVCSW